MTDSAQIRKQLLTRQAELLKDDEARREANETVELDQISIGHLSTQGDVQELSLSKEVERRRQVKLRKISAALARIETGDYGYCLSCDELISEGRLAFDPAATLCIDCANKQA